MSSCQFNRNFPKISTIENCKSSVRNTEIPKKEEATQAEAQPTQNADTENFPDIDVENQEEVAMD